MKDSILMLQQETIKRTDSRDVVVRMTEILRFENAALAEMDFARAGSFLYAKYAAADALAAAWRNAQLVDVPQMKIRNLIAEAEENRRLLKGAMLVQTRALDHIRRVTKTPPSKSAHNAPGRTQYYKSNVAR